MYTNNLFLLTVAAATGASANIVLAQRAVQARTVANQGWSLQSNTAVSGLVSCGDGAYCPASSSCVAASPSVAAACCPTSSNCIGAIEGDPSCADPTWTLYKNNEGNGFCCTGGQVGAFNSSEHVGAGFCTDSVGSSDTSAILVSSATLSSGATSTSAAPTASVVTGETSTTASTPTTTPSGSHTNSSSTRSHSPSPTSGGSSGTSGTNSTSPSTSTSPAAIGGSAAIQNSVGSGLVLLAGVLGFAFAL